MTEHSATVYRNGHYRVVEWDDPDGDESSRRYVVVDANGAPLRYELTLEDAKAWLEIRLQQENGEPEPPQPQPLRPRPRPKQRR